MVKLYRYSEKKSKWVLVDYGVKSKAEAYASQGFVVIYI